MEPKNRWWYVEYVLHYNTKDMNKLLCTRTKACSALGAGRKVVRTKMKNHTIMFVRIIRVKADGKA